MNTLNKLWVHVRTVQAIWNLGVVDTQMLQDSNPELYLQIWWVCAACPDCLTPVMCWGSFHWQLQTACGQKQVPTNQQPAPQLKQAVWWDIYLPLHKFLVTACRHALLDTWMLGLQSNWTIRSVPPRTWGPFENKCAAPSNYVLVTAWQHSPALGLLRFLSGCLRSAIFL